MLSVLHVNNPAGVATHLSRGQRKLGLQSDVLLQHSHQFEYSYDYLYEPEPPKLLESSTVLGGGWKVLRRFSNVVSLVREYDVIHFHMSSILDYRKPLFPRGLDVPIYKSLGKDVVVHHHGSDIRGTGEPFFHDVFADELLVSTPDLLNWSPDATWVPNPVDIDSIPFVGATDDGPPYRIVHAPSDREKKGTEHVIEAVENVSGRGYEVELEIVEETPRDEALEIYKSADVIVDQVKLGWYGVFSVEGMALGKPVCVYIDEELQSHISESPLVNATPETLADRLERLLEDDAHRERIGEDGRRFAEDVHGQTAVAEQMVELYENID